MKKLKKVLSKTPFVKSEPTEDMPAENPPRITNETVAEHREAVLGRARKYILPLQHSKHRIIVISLSLLIATLVAFFAYCTLALYRFQDNSVFMYRVTQVIPFPIARSGSNFVAYENYLFELRHYMHYYEHHQELDFSSDAGQRQLAEFKRRALEKVINDSYIKQLAREHSIAVSSQEVDDQIAIVRSQNRLGGNEQVLEDVLREFWGWSLDDFKRSLHQQLLSEKLVAELDTETQERAQAAYAQLESGVDFADVAQEFSDDPATRDNGGAFGFDISRSDRNLTAHTTDALFRLDEGEYSEVINIGYALQIVKLSEREGEQVKGAHILFNLKDVEEFINDKKAEQPARSYITLPEPPEQDPTELPPELQE
ncbi:MAG: peptidylprolyl isomerase [Candidatus Saccharibacteria bacterium]|nr:peptidylprolyl isomerase [Candidatus Saccharibacteria bacterium]